MEVKKVLFLEDEEFDFKRMKELLSPEFELIQATSGEIALKILEVNKEVKAVLLDIFLTSSDTGEPLPMQGEEVAREIKNLNPKIPIIVVSKGFNINAPIQGYFWKGTLFEIPESIEGLKEALRSAISYFEGTLSVQRYYPQDGGNDAWKNMWGPKYQKLRESEIFSEIEQFISKQALYDFQMLENSKGKINYASLREPNNLLNVLIARRVVFALMFDNLKQNNYEQVDWHCLCSLLGFSKISDIFDYIASCGAVWGRIYNKETLLLEEEQWLGNNGFIPFIIKGYNLKKEAK
jgi:CheY-like chemotaxis protein